MGITIGGMMYCRSEIRGSLLHVKAILLDWAGTTIDFGCMAPTYVFTEIFRTIGIDVTVDEAREPMGLAKIDHIRAMLRMPSVQDRWRSHFGRASNEVDVQELYERFLPLQKRILEQHSEMIPGVLDALAWCRKRGWRVGSTTGYTRALMEVVIPLARAQGYVPDVVVCSDEVASGRPAPWQLFRAAEALGVFPMHQILVVDDSQAGIDAGKAAGCITVAVCATGNALGMPFDSWNRLPPAEQHQRLTPIQNAFIDAGADIVLSSLADLPNLLSEH